MITLKEWMETFNYRITEGDRYGWSCYGNAAHQLSAWNGKHGDGGWSGNIVFDTENQTVYEVEICDYTNERAYRIINPHYKKAHDAEAKNHGAYADTAWDGTNFIDLEVDKDWLEKAEAIVNGFDYDDRVEVSLDIEDDVILALSLEAHKRDITLNNMVEILLQQAIKERA